MDPIRNIFACLVHEKQECVIDLVRNLRALDPSSLILLYNGGNDSELLNHRFPFERHGAVIHPRPRTVAWGRLHQFALDSMEWALENHPFDTITIVDSDQLATRAGYSEYLAHHLKSTQHVGLLGNSTIVQTAGTRIGPAEVALRERELWRPLLRQFPGGEEKYPHWCFWPSTVFLADAARDLIRCFGTNELLRRIMERTSIWATEELILPTLVALLGYEIGASPCSYDFVQYRVNYSPQDVGNALRREDVFWVHPVLRHYDDPLRKLIRDRLSQYEALPSEGDREQRPAAVDLLLTVPILERMRAIEGWLEDAEADLLIATVARAITTHPEAPAVVEVGSYCGRATVVLGSTAAAIDPSGKVRVHAVDSHDGIIGSLDRPIHTTPSLERFRRNVCLSGLSDRVESIVKRSFEVEWSKPICFLLIDGLHDYPSVAQDFYHFAPTVALGGLIAFHDYAPYWPGVKTFVDELLESGCYEKVGFAGSMMVVRKSAEVKVDAARARTTPPMEGSQLAAAPAVVTRQPLVSCIMPTADRRALVPQAIRYFQRQDYPCKELLVLDDGVGEIADLIPKDASIRYVRMDQRRTMGAKHNAGCELARGEIMVHWDDDDWMADWRLSYQVDTLLAQPRDTLSGLSRLFFWDPRARSAWEYVYNGERPWVCGGTFCYWRQFWETHRHPDMNEGADTVFVWGLHGTNVLPLEKHGFYVALVHARNTSPKRTNTSGWHAFPVDRVRQLLASDLGFYEDCGRVFGP
jgi:hypothetical protein